ncbi:MAG: L-seryl-tRNA(Sec) selenium transferase [Bryobacterales bacterium]|nr:L-seryl-tRNA(Sec) selenium transferase [Bryobacterales bacterium]
MDAADALRQLPSVDEVARSLSGRCPGYPRKLVAGEIRRVLERRRELVRRGLAPTGDVSSEVLQTLERLDTASLRPVINATGVVLHTNLGRAPLGPGMSLEGYSNLEYNLELGKRGKRDTHLDGLLERVLGAPGIAVNNNAAAVFLALHELAAGYEVIVSRGELIEIGDGFRIPDIMQRSGAILREVGTTNRTHPDDYRAAINERTRLLLRVHPSNFRVTGFTARPSPADLAALGREHGIPVYEDLGSGCLVDLRPFGIDEPVAGDSLAAGIDLVSFSGDKLLGGPQAGIVAGRADLVQRLRRNPMFRALRIDKLITHSLAATLRALLFERWDEIPALRLIRQDAAAIRTRAEALLPRLEGCTARLVEGESVIGGGATPEQAIPTWLIEIDARSASAAEAKLRAGDPPVIARIADDRILIDLRTVFAGEEEALAAALRSACSR